LKHKPPELSEPERKKSMADAKAYVKLMPHSLPEQRQVHIALLLHSQ